ncbi:hypothetical protein [Haliangium ochraceum]|uniref:Glycosyltransferase RgtA/B/C/D-like domain-containing protein n=1 Tax=Haliangium ochraceum (strain DSM 14365 / JCM 11303 / SMP-2) TaxID=502025 RepID=D0LU67_HALO1|nr:hypothetical protein [Haliangium ochraceum]ACY17431.1 hypothetical protein Hoch_4942 [Haliangium ochraceum DSM 14365]
MATPLYRRPAVAVFALCFACYAYFYQAGGWNQNVRFDLVRSWVEQGSARIDSFYRNTGDLACRGPQGRCLRPAPAQGKHAYADKAPGVSMLAVPAHAAVHALRGDGPAGPRYLDTAAYLSTLWAIALPSALSVALLCGLLGALGLGAGARVAFALAYGLATLAFPYATLLYGHQLTAALLLMAFAVLVRARHDQVGLGRGALFGVGALLGAAVLVEYPAALAVLPICVYALAFVRPLPRLGWLLAGGALAAAVLAGYHALVFGGPLTLPYEFSTQPHRSQGFFMGLGMPEPAAVSGILVSSYRGLLFSAPWLLLALPGAVVLARRSGLRAELAVCAVIFALFVWLNASLVDWQGGWALGPRYLVPALPFVAVLAAAMALVPAPAALRALGWLVFAALSGYAAYLMLVGTAVKPEVPVYVAEPFADYLLPRFAAGDLAVNTQSIDAIGASPRGERFAWNLGQLLGLRGRLSLLPLAALVLALGAWLVACVRAQRRSEHDA